VILCEGGLVTGEHLSITIVPPPVAAAPRSPDAFPVEGLQLEAVERDLIQKALAAARNNKSHAAKLLGLPRGQLYSLLRRYGLTEARR
jgi:two-component system NtrC family response regulator